MAQVINLEGLPDPVAKAIAETVLNLKVHYGAKGVGSKPPRKLTAADADQALEELLDTLLAHAKPLRRSAKPGEHLHAGRRRPLDGCFDRYKHSHSTHRPLRRPAQRSAQASRTLEDRGDRVWIVRGRSS